MRRRISDATSFFYVKNSDIDRVKWDKCISNAPNGLIYAFSSYLDAMAVHWDALVMNDYESVMPVTWNKKFGICYLYQPFLCASLGVFGNDLTPEKVAAFLNRIPQYFKYWDIYLNRGNNFTTDYFDHYKRTNYILSLDKPYPLLFKNFRESYKHSIKKKVFHGLEVKQNIDVENIISLARAGFRKFAKIKKTDWLNFSLLYKFLFAQQKAVNYGIYLKDRLLASGVFFFSHDRAYYVLAGNQAMGRTSGASHLVINAFIETYAGQDLILDFEGSNVEGIAFFFKGFGAQPEEYYGVRYNGLPPLLKLLKK